MKYNKILGIYALAFSLISAVASAQQDTPPVTPAPPPSAPATNGASELEKLVAPIALYPDPLISIVLPASVYPLDIVQAARFVKDTNNIAKLDEQPWDENVKAVAHFPDVIAKMNEDIAWTSDLGQAFLNQQKDVMDAIQTMRAKAQTLGTLKTTPQQVVVVTNTVIEKTVEQQVIYVTNTVVQIQPSNPQVVYVPAYDPWYAYYPPPVYYVGPPPAVTFAVGVTVGVIIANNCDWHHGGIYVGHHGVAVWGGGGWGHNDVDIDINRNVNINKNDLNINKPKGQGQKWQPDQNRLRSSGAPGAAKSLESRGWGSSSAGRAATPSTFSQNLTAPSAGASRAASSPAVSSAARNAGDGFSSRARDSAFGGVSNGSRDRSFSQRGSFSRSGGGRSGGGRRR